MSNVGVKLKRGVNTGNNVGELLVALSQCSTVGVSISCRNRTKARKCYL